MSLRPLISVFALSFAAFTVGALTGLVVVDTSGPLGVGAVLGSVSSLFLALVLTTRRGFFGKIILLGALAGLIAYPITAWISPDMGWLVGGAIFGLAEGLAHWRLLKNELSPTWVVVLILGWGMGIGVWRSAGNFYGLLLGAILFALVITLAAAMPLGIVRGWATQPNRSAARRQPRPELRRGLIKSPSSQPLRKTLTMQRAGSRRKL